MKNQIFEMKCIDMTYEGYGVCKYQDLVVFVKGMIVDEVALVKIISYKKTYAYGIIDKLIEKSKYRIKELCPIAYKCGGCDLRHIDYDFQLHLKQKAIKEQVKRQGLNVLVNEVVKSPLSEAYRNKVAVPYKDGQCGFYRSNSHDIVSFDYCYVQTERVNNILKDIKAYLSLHDNKTIRHIMFKEGFTTGEIMVAFIASNECDLNELVKELIDKYPDIKSVILNINNKDTNVILGDKELVLYGRDYIIDELDGLKFKISLKSFYQINPKQTVNLYKGAISKANINKDTKVLDLYSGIGSISLFMARDAAYVKGVEIVPSAIQNANDNAKLNNITNVDFVLSDAKDNLKKHLKGMDVVVVDPPRKGLSLSVIEDLCDSNIDNIVYISCNPLTLLRDIKLFNERNYDTQEIDLYDMFPHTSHVECVTLLQRKK